MNIGTIDLERLLDQSVAGRELSRELESRAQAWQRDLRTLEADIEMLRKREGTRSDLQLKQLEKQQTQERMRLQIEAMRAEMRQTLLTRIETIATAVAEEENVALVLTRPNPIVVYAANEIDLTEVVMKRLDAPTP